MSDATSAPTLPPESRQFDFWLGNWELSWGDNQHGTNRIERILNGHVVQENFSSDGDAPFVGTSVSVFNVQTSKWQQTWVDNAGGYLDFTGAFADGKMILSREALLDGKSIRQRMVWHDIQPDRLMWNWERSEDGGQTWQVLWEITYTHKPD